MRTKALLCAAALAVGALTSMAQVYSLNIVGYYQVTCNNGFTAIANQLTASPDNTVNSVIRGLPDNGCSVMFWDGSAFAENIFYGADTWDDNSSDFSPGVGAFLKNQNTDPVVLTFVGQVPTGTLTKTLSPGYSFVGSQVPQGGNLETDLGLVPAQNDSIMVWDGSAFAENIYYDVGTWDADPIVTVGQCFFYKNQGTADVIWTRTFNP